jgi:hypothetical protein
LRAAWTAILYAFELTELGFSTKSRLVPRNSSMSVTTVREMKAHGLGATAIAKALGISLASVYRVLVGAWPST